MRIAWFRSRPVHPSDHLDETGDTIGRLVGTHDVHVIGPDDAHDFVWQHFREPFDLCVYELTRDAPAAFIWPYVFRYPGVLAVSGASLHDARAMLLEQQGRTDDYVAEFTFNEGRRPRLSPVGLPRGSWPMLRAAVVASRAVVVRSRYLAEEMGEQHPDARIRYVPLGASRMTTPGTPSPHLRCAVYGAERLPVVERARSRAALAGADVTVVAGSTSGQLDGIDAVLALTWPAAGESLMPALAGMAAGRPVVMFETRATSGWPTLDPHTWRARGPAPEGAPVVITIDPRDEEHSLMLVLRRLAAEPPLRQSLSDAGHAWWQSRATPDHAFQGWEQVMREAATIEPPRKPHDWPAHLRADGTTRVRQVLEEFGASVDFLI